MTVPKVMVLAKQIRDHPPTPLWGHQAVGDLVTLPYSSHCRPQGEVENEAPPPLDGCTPVPLQHLNLGSLKLWMFIF